MLQSQSCQLLNPTSSTVFQTLLPIHRVSINPVLPLLLVQYKVGIVSVLRIADLSTFLTIQGTSSALAEWSCRGDKLLVLDNHLLSEYVVDTGKLAYQQKVDLDVARFSSLQHFVVLLDSARSLTLLLPNGQSFPVSKDLQNMEVYDLMTFDEGMFVVGDDECDDFCATKFLFSIQGDLKLTRELEERVEGLISKKAKTAKSLDTLKECLLKWKSAAFVDFISINQLVHFWIKYEQEGSIKRNATELQRLEVIYKDTLELVCNSLEAEDEDILQSFGHAVSQLTILLTGADDLELMSVKLSDVVSHLKTLSIDIDFVVRTIVSKLECSVSNAQQQLSEHCSSIELKFTRCFECAFPRHSIMDVQCIDGNIYFALKNQHQIDFYENNCLIRSYSNMYDCERLFILSKSLIVFCKDSSVYCALEDGNCSCLLSGLVDVASIAVSKNASQFVVVLDDTHCKVYEIFGLFHSE